MLDGVILEGSPTRLTQAKRAVAYIPATINRSRDASHGKGRKKPTKKSKSSNTNKLDLSVNSRAKLLQLTFCTFSKIIEEYET